MVKTVAPATLELNAIVDKYGRDWVVNHKYEWETNFMVQHVKNRNKRQPFDDKLVVRQMRISERRAIRRKYWDDWLKHRDAWWDSVAPTRPEYSGVSAVSFFPKFQTSRPPVPPRSRVKHVSVDAKYKTKIMDKATERATANKFRAAERSARKEQQRRDIREFKEQQRLAFIEANKPA